MRYHRFPMIPIEKISGFQPKLLYAVAYVAAGVGCVSAAPRAGIRRAR